jgi:hypothetical protein
MNNSDEQANAASADAGAGDEEIEKSSPGSPKDEGKEESGGGILAFFIIGFVVSLVIGWVVYPRLLYSDKKQPIDFNHAVHNEEVDDGCESCHFFRDDGTFSGVPKLAQCVDCHEEVQGDDPSELKFVEEYISKEREVPWLIYSRQPDCVFFSHAAHVKMGKMECVTCHGHIGESESLKVYSENRLTGYSRDIWGANIENMLGFKKNTWDRMKMDDCAKCHKAETGRATSVQTQKDGCFVCHK